MHIYFGLMMGLITFLYLFISSHSCNANTIDCGAINLQSTCEQTKDGCYLHLIHKKGCAHS